MILLGGIAHNVHPASLSPSAFGLGSVATCEYSCARSDATDSNLRSSSGPFIQRIEEAFSDRSVDEVVCDIIRRVNLPEESNRKSTASHIMMPASTPYVAEGIIEKIADVKTRIACPGAQVYLVGNDAVHSSRTDTL